MISLILISTGIDSVYNYLLKSLKLNPKTTSYKVEIIGLNFYNVLIRSYDKKIKDISKIEEKLKELGLIKKDSIFLGKLLSNEVIDLRVSINKDTLTLDFKMRISPRSIIFDEKKIENYLISVIENATSIKIDKKKIKTNLEAKTDFYNFKIVFKGEKNAKFSEDDITKIKNALLRDNIYAMDYQLGKLIYVRFSGLIENYIIYDSYIKYFEDSLLADIKIKKPGLKTTRVASEILRILTSVSKDKIVGFGLNDIGQDLVDGKLANIIKIDIILRKDVDFEDIRNKIIDKGSEISQNKNAYLVAGIIVVSNPILGEDIYKTIRIEFGNFSDYEMFKIGSANVEVQ